jgi:hypothetical protein
MVVVLLREADRQPQRIKPGLETKDEALALSVLVNGQTLQLRARRRLRTR